MANSDFSKEEIVAFEQLLEGFEDALIMSKHISIYKTNQQTMARAGDTIWRPQPYILTAYNGQDQSNNFQRAVQMSVPATIGYATSVPFLMDAKELRDQLQEQRLAKSASQRLSSAINIAVTNVVTGLGSLVVKRTGSAVGFDDIAQCDSIMNERGIMMDDRAICLSSRDYNNMASNLAGRQTMTGKPATAYERAHVGVVSGFDTFKLDWANQQSASLASSVTINGANQYYVPQGTNSSQLGQRNVDNRFQNITVTVGSGTLSVGDSFALAGVNSVHHISKVDSGQLMTFRVTQIISGNGGSGVVQITPPIISGQGGSDGELAYQNVTATPANGAAMTMLNTVTAKANPFWHRDSIELLPARYEVPVGAGVAVLRQTTEQGVDVVFTKFVDIDTLNVKYRFDTLFGVANLNPEMNGVMYFNQV